MVLAYYNKWIPLEQVRRDCGISRDGSNADNVMRAAQGYGLTVELSHPEAEEIIHHGQFPCIIQWNDTHYLVLDGFRHGKAYVSDPAFGAYTVELENFGFCYTGTCLNFRPGESFEPSGKPKSIWRFARRKLAGCGAAFALVVISTVISSLTGLITPGMTKVFSDRLLTGQNPEWFGPFMAIMAALAAVELTVTWIESVYSLKANGKIAVVGNSEYMWHVLRLPVECFSQRQTGDIAMRKQTNETIASTMINTFTPLILNVATMMFYLIVMIRYNAFLSLIGVISILLNSALSKYISIRRSMFPA
jgi:ABC-type bacteriocin/lantibiotic exporter with double-glycine peptidase domain